MFDFSLSGVKTEICNVCGGRDFIQLAKRSDNISVIVCQRCGMGALEFIPDDTSIFYDDNYYKNATQDSDAGYSDYDVTSEHGVLWASELLKIIRSDGRVLDIGCANGFLLYALGDGYEVFGIEANEKAAKSAEMNGIKIIGNDLLDANLLSKYTSYFDVITAIAVFEHIKDFSAAVEVALKMLKPDGILIFEVPLMSESNSNDTWFTSSLEHLYYPTIKGLRYLFDVKLEAPMIGGELVIRDYASTYVGLATRSELKFPQLENIYNRIMLESASNLIPDERRVQLILKIIHAADYQSNQLHLIHELFSENRKLPFLLRCLELWRATAAKLHDTLNYLAKVEAAKIWHSENSKSWKSLYENHINENASTFALLSGISQLPTDPAKSEIVAVQSERDTAMAERDIAITERDAAVAENNTSISERNASISERDAAIYERDIAVARLKEIQSERNTAIDDCKSAQAARDAILSELYEVYHSTSWRFIRKLIGVVSTTSSLMRVLRKLLHQNLRLFTFKRLGRGLSLLRSGNIAELGAAVSFVANESAKHDRQNLLPELIDNKKLLSNQVLISVVIPCFNYGQFVNEAIESVLAQTLKNVEIIVVDGGSTDGTTIEVLKKIKLPRTEIEFREGRHLVGDNRNFGIKKARGRYICCLDADDTLDPTYLEKAVFHLETYGYDVVSTSINFVGARKGHVDTSEFPNLEDMVDGNHVLTCAVFRKEHWDSVGGYFDVGIGAHHVAEDWDFWLRLAAQGARIRNISKEHLFNYRIHAHGSLSSAVDVKTLEDQKTEIFKRNSNLLTPHAFDISSKNQAKYLRGDPLHTALAEEVRKSSCNQNKKMLLAIPFSLVGGAERLLSGLCKFLTRRGWQITVINTLPQEKSFGSSIDWFKESTAEVYTLSNFLHTRELADFIQYLISSRQPECILNAGSRLLYEQLPSIKKNFPKVSVIDLLFNTVGHTKSHLEFREYISFAMAENEEVHRWFMDVAGWTDGCVKKVSSGVDLLRYQPKCRSQYLVDKYNIAPDEIIVGFSGRLSNEKAPDIFVEVARQCIDIPKLRFLMTGAGPMSAAILKQVEALPAGVKFDFVGLVDDVDQYISLYDVLLLPSRFDGRPLVVMEALASGVAVMATNVGGLSDLVVDDINGYLIPAADAKLFVAHIPKLVADPQLLSRLKVGARHTAISKLNSDEAYLEYEIALTKAIEINSSLPVSVVG